MAIASFIAFREIHEARVLAMNSERVFRKVQIIHTCRLSELMLTAASSRCPVIRQVVVRTGVSGRGLLTLSTILVVVKPLRERERMLLVRQPQRTQFSLAVKRLNCTLVFSASQLSGITGGVLCPEMRWRVITLHQMLATIRCNV